MDPRWYAGVLLPRDFLRGRNPSISLHSSETLQRMDRRQFCLSGGPLPDCGDGHRHGRSRQRHSQYGACLADACARRELRNLADGCPEAVACRAGWAIVRLPGSGRRAGACHLHHGRADCRDCRVRGACIQLAGRLGRRFVPVNRSHDAVADVWWKFRRPVWTLFGDRGLLFSGPVFSRTVGQMAHCGRVFHVGRRLVGASGSGCLFGRCGGRDRLAEPPREH